MAAVTPQMVKQLREQTGAGMSDCKKALDSTQGDLEAAVKVLREKGLAAAAKKSGRATSEGVVEAVLTPDRACGMLVEINCETDFVTRNEGFQNFVTAVKSAIEASKPTDLSSVLAAPFGNGQTVQDATANMIATIGENMSVRRFARLGEPGTLVQSYVHGGGKVGVLVQLSGDNLSQHAENPELLDAARDVALQVAAMKPQFLDKESISAANLEKEKEVFTNQYRNQGKPENILPKIVANRLESWFKEVCLVDQSFVKDDSKTIKQFLSETGKRLGVSHLAVTAFERLELGEGVEKKEENFAAEVEAQIKKGSGN